MYIMKNTDDLVKVFVGTETAGLLLKDKLDGIGVAALIKNDSWVAFFGAAPSLIDLYIKESDLNKAKKLLIEFTEKIR